MKTITINVSEPVYRELQEYARTHDRTTSELVREAMAAYRDRLGRKRLLDTFLAATYFGNGVTSILTTNARDYTTFGGFELLAPELS